MRFEAEVERLLREDAAVLLRTSSHKIYRLSNGKNFVMPMTPSDRRSAANQLTRLRHLLGIRREINKNPNRKDKPGVKSQACFQPERIELKSGWRAQLKSALAQSKAAGQS